MHPVSALTESSGRIATSTAPYAPAYSEPCAALVRRAARIGQVSSQLHAILEAEGSQVVALVVPKHTHDDGHGHRRFPTGGRRPFITSLYFPVGSWNICCSSLDAWPGACSFTTWESSITLADISLYSRYRSRFGI